VVTDLVLHTIKERRSIHNFKHEKVDSSILNEIFTYASYAPTHHMKEPWNIKVYQDNGKNALVKAIINSYQRHGLIKNDNQPQTKKTIDSISQFLLDIPHHALIYFYKESNPIRYEEIYASICAFIQNAQLAGWEYGVGMLWTITPYMHDLEFVKEIGLNGETVKVAAVLQIGYPADIPKDKGRIPIHKKIEYISD